MPQRRSPSGAAPPLSWQSGHQLPSSMLAYRFVDLEQVPGFGSAVHVRSRAEHLIVASRACAINSAGQITGFYTAASLHHYAYLCTESRCSDLVRNAVGLAIGESGDVAGSYENAAGNTRAFAFIEGKRVDIGTLGGATSMAMGISEAGVTGVSEDANQRRRAFLWTRDKLLDLGVPPGGPAPRSVNRWRHSEGRAINRFGQIAGICSHFTSGAAIFGRNRRQFLGTLGGVESKCFAINNHGNLTGGADITGTDPTNGGPVHAFLYRDGQMIDLGSLGGQIAEGLAINDKDVVVGQAQTPSGQMHAFVVVDDQMHDLNQYLPADSEFEVLVSAQGINRYGQIVGYGISIHGRERAFLMTPL